MTELVCVDTDVSAAASEVDMASLVCTVTAAPSMTDSAHPSADVVVTTSDDS